MLRFLASPVVSETCCTLEMPNLSQYAVFFPHQGSVGALWY